MLRIKRIPISKRIDGVTNFLLDLVPNTHGTSYDAAIMRSGSEEACWAHNPEVAGSKPVFATRLFFRT